MPQDLTIGQLLLKKNLPEDLQHFAFKTLDKKGINELFTELTKRPEIFNHVGSELARIGFETATNTGTSVSLKDLQSPIDKKKRFDEADADVKKIKQKHLSKREEDVQINDVYEKMTDQIDKDILDEGVKQNISLAKSIRAGSRGSIGQYRATVVGPGIVVDGNQNPIFDIPVKHSFAEGLSLPEYLVSTYSARDSEVKKKLSVADSGFFSKQLSRAGLNIQVEEHDCGTNNGIPVSIDDKDSVGTFLAHPAGSYKKNTEVLPNVLADLKQHGVTELIVRSPITCEASRHFHSGAVCQLCVGMRENGLPEMKSFVAVIAGGAMSEPLTQSQLSAKHCCQQDTLVRMGDFSVKAIKDLKIGDEVLGASKEGVVCKTRVLDVIDQGIQECFNFRFRVGDKQQFIEIEATKDHVCLANTRVSSQKDEIYNHSIRLRKIGEKRKYWNLVFPTAVDLDQSKLIDEPYALLIGLLLGDGNTRKISHKYLTSFDPLLIEDIKDYLSNLRLKASSRPSRKTEYLISATDYQRARQTGKTNDCYLEVNRVMNRYDLVGKYAHQKTIPSNFMQWNDRSLKDLVTGLFSTDGSVYTINDNGITRLYIQIGLSSYEMMQQICHLLFWRFGIVTKIQHEKKKGKLLGITYKGKSDYVAQHDMWVLIIADSYSVNKFINTFKFVGIKAQKIQTNKHHVKVPVGNFYTCGRKSITPIGLQQCYDITVDCPDNLFVLANGAIVHNSINTAGASRKLNQGFELVNQLANIPKNFPGEAAISSKTGKVTKIEALSSGGHNVVVDEDEHYVEPGFKIHVKKGDDVEQGDIMSEGVINPRKITEYRGIGEGRRSYVENMYSAFKNARIPVNRRNFELIAKGAIDHVKITDPEGMGNYLPDEIVSYQQLEKDYKPPESSKRLRVDIAHGKFLQEPVLHYTIGTPVTKLVQKALNKHKVDSVLVSEHPPGFEPQMVSLLSVPEHQDDLFSQMYSTYIERRLLNSVNTGRSASSDLKGPSPILGIAYGKGFGDTQNVKPV